MNFLFLCNGIRIPESGKFLLLEKNLVGKFNVKFIHTNNQVQVLFVEELSILYMTPANTVVSPCTAQLISLSDILSLYVLFFQ